MVISDKVNIINYLENFKLNKFNNGDSKKKGKKTGLDIYIKEKGETIIEKFEYQGMYFMKFINEFWTSKQRQSSSLHEISYRACYKAQLPRFFIEIMTKKGDYVYDPFAGRGTTGIEAALMGRNIILNDINPLSKILSKPRLNIPTHDEIEKRLDSIKMDYNLKAEIDISMFYHPKTESEIVSLKKYLNEKKLNGEEDFIDEWIRMVATNRLTGHSKGFFSVYTLPPNQAVLPERQLIINKKRNQTPEYKEIKPRIIKKSKSLLRNLSKQERNNLKSAANKAIFLTLDAQKTKNIPDNFVQLTVTSPPFLNVVQYSDDNWLRCWFNSLDVNEISKKITIENNINEWTRIMTNVFKELYRITKVDGFVAFEVGEIRNGKINLDEYILPIGLKVGFNCIGILINSQNFTKTSNIWGIKNNKKGTNSNRIVIFQK
ncbi:MAG: site-specific DNA-methyltransferase [Candidatus Lokiarchaeota archaeon]|nr:site-specific DNA-methyltransferase [Candidatus Harpocratesius repetitus]